MPISISTKQTLSDGSEQSAVQREAIAAGVALLHDSGEARARFSMACGVGKTLTQLKLAEALIDKTAPGPRRILVLVPTLALVRQSRDEWEDCNVLGDEYASLCVCSDPSLKEGVLQARGDDDVELDAQELAELGIEVGANARSDIARINRWLDERERAPGASPNAVSVIFSTYQSAQVVGMALAARAAGDRALDIGVFDEAHKTAGAAGKAFAYALSDANLRIGKRMFFTATERVRAEGAGEDDALITMDDEAVYGPRAYSISFRQAAARGIIVPFKVIVSVVNDDAIGEQELAARAVRGEAGERLDARSIANLSALSRAMQEYGLSKAITFHGEVARAQAFAELPTQLAFAQGLARLHVNGRQSPGERREQMQRYAQADGARAAITNARCLTEGVNVPATDIVAFMDPKRGKVDIMQAVGRALRRSAGKEAGYVLLPLHVSARAGESAEQALARSAQDFQQIREVLQALAESDEALKDEMRRVVQAGINGPQGAGRGLGELPIVLMTDGNGGELSAQALAQAITTRIIGEMLGDSDAKWERGFAALVAFKAEHGHCEVPSDHKAAGFNLGRWLGDQRTAAKKSNYPADRRARLEALGVRLETKEKLSPDASFERGFAALVAFKAEYGHCDVPSDHKVAGFNLGFWLGGQRMRAKKSNYPEDRRARLEALGVRLETKEQLSPSAAFERGFAALVAFKAEHGHCEVPKGHRAAGIDLGNWLKTQRQAAKNADYPEDRRARLEVLGVVWEPRDALFERGFAALVAFKAEHGHCDVPVGHQAGGIDLGTWLNSQRQAAKKSNYPEDRRARLEALGVRLETKEKLSPDASFERGFAALVAFKAERGHCNVPKGHRAAGIDLGNWLKTQRQAAKKPGYPEDRRALLEALGVRLETRAAQAPTQAQKNPDASDPAFTEFSAQARAYHAEHGHCEVPLEFGPLGAWCADQRLAAEQGLCSPERLEQLMEIGVVRRDDPTSTRERMRA